MDADSSNVYQEFNNMQLKIGLLFQDLMKERNNYKENFENLNTNLKQLSIEAESIRKENKELKEINNEMKNVFCKSIKIFKSVNFISCNLKNEQKIELENLKKNFFDIEGMIQNIKSTEINKKPLTESPENLTVINNQRDKRSEEEIQEFEYIKNLNFSTQFFCDDDTTLNTCKKESNSEFVPKNTIDSKIFDEKLENLTDAFLMNETKDFDWEQSSGSGYNSELPSKRGVLSKSPVFKDFGVHKQDNIHNEDEEDLNGISFSYGSDRTSKSASDKSEERSKNLIISPWKKSSDLNGSSPSKEPRTPKRVRKKLNINSPRRSPNVPLKKSNFREAEISMSGVRKLTQTLLNVECFKKKSQENWKSYENRENENFPNINEVIKSEAKKSADAEEDDFIIESPNKIVQPVEDPKKKNRNGDVLNDVQLITPPDTSDPDLDETYISASVVRKCKLTKKHSLEKLIEDQTPIKRPAREKSFDYDSVSFVYKRDPVRKKSERMKLPGHACLKCNKYYEDALGDIDTEDLKKVLNKCSRHRDNISPSHEETPPGFWKPYLTCSIKVSPKKND